MSDGCLRYLRGKCIPNMQESEVLKFKLYIVHSWYIHFPGDTLAGTCKTWIHCVYRQYFSFKSTIYKVPIKHLADLFSFCCQISPKKILNWLSWLQFYVDIIPALKLKNNRWLSFATYSGREGTLNCKLLYW